MDTTIRPDRKNTGHRAIEWPSLAEVVLRFKFVTYRHPKTSHPASEKAYTNLDSGSVATFQRLVGLNLQFPF